MVLAPVARNTAIAVYVIAPTVLLQSNMTEFFRYYFFLAEYKKKNKDGGHCTFALRGYLWLG
jgi:hypothetical protein